MQTESELLLALRCQPSAEDAVRAAVRWQSSPVAQRLRDAWPVDAKPLDFEAQRHLPIDTGTAENGVSGTHGRFDDADSLYSAGQTQGSDGMVKHGMSDSNGLFVHAEGLSAVDANAGTSSLGSPIPPTATTTQWTGHNVPFIPSPKVPRAPAATASRRRETVPADHSSAPVDSEEPRTAPPSEALNLQSRHFSDSGRGMPTRKQQLATTEVSSLQDVYSSMRELLWETAALRHEALEGTSVAAKAPREPEPEPGPGPEPGVESESEVEPDHTSLRVRRGSWAVGDMRSAACQSVAAAPPSLTRVPPPRARVGSHTLTKASSTVAPRSRQTNGSSPTRMVTASPPPAGASPTTRRSTPRVPHPTHSPDASSARSTARFSPTLHGSRIDFTDDMPILDNGHGSTAQTRSVHHHAPSSPSLSACEQRKERIPPAHAQRRALVAQPQPHSQTQQEPEAEDADILIRQTVVSPGQEADAPALQARPSPQTATVKSRLAVLLSGVWRAVGARAAHNSRATGSRGLGNLPSAVENVHLDVQPNGFVRGGPVPDLRLSEVRAHGESGDSSVVLKSGNAFLIRGMVELTNDGFIGQMVLEQQYLDGSVTHWSGHFFADDDHLSASDGQQQQPRQGLLFGGKWSGDLASGNFAARQVFPRYDLLDGVANGALPELKQTP